MHDAIALTNLIYAMPTKTSADITAIFKEYQEERLPAVTESFENSQLMSKMTARGITGTILRIVITYMPWWMWKRALTKTVRFRPQVGFLPNIPYMGTVTIAEVIVNISGECPQAEYLKAVSVQGTVPPDVSPSDVKAKEVFQKVKTVFGINFTI
ncbi:hypothetical protein BGZ97_010489 [Linnemannia gamsii]|uniref:Uncharacterized protein n=1 Tax=Linnemannia gamsii TaxID=64522 RepID=A0A9P6QKL1_9FUNG|nr:hypothetical protein BGZ97_010489 [Linnemannia gamsii]